MCSFPRYIAVGQEWISGPEWEICWFDACATEKPGETKLEDLPKKFDVKIIGADDCEECSLVSNAFRWTSFVVQLELDITMLCCRFNFSTIF